MFVVKVLARNQIQRRQSVGGAATCHELTFHTAKGGLVLLGLVQLHIKPSSLKRVSLLLRPFYFFCWCSFLAQDVCI